MDQDRSTAGQGILGRESWELRASLIREQGWGLRKRELKDHYMLDIVAACDLNE